MDWSCRNSDCWFGIQSCGFKFLFVYFFSINFSSTFEIVSSNLIGRDDETSYEFFPGLCIIIICGIFNDLGQYSSRSMALNIYIRFIRPSFDSSFSILAVIKSKPGDFLWFNVLISSFVSSKVNVLRHSCD